MGCVSYSCVKFEGENNQNLDRSQLDLLEKYVTIASKHNSFMLELFYNIDINCEKMMEKLKPYLKQGAEAKTKFDNVSVPSAPTKQWVLLNNKTMPYLLYMRFLLLTSYLLFGFSCL